MESYYSRLLADIESCGTRTSSGCLIWKYSCTAKFEHNDYRGYGVLWVRDRVVYVTRVVYHHFIDDQFPIVSTDKSIIIDHLCRITNCYEPTHLEKKTQRENVSIGRVGKLKAGKTSSYTGVYWSLKGRRRWVATIKTNGKKTYLGSFAQEVDAANAYQRALQKLGEAV